MELWYLTKPEGELGSISSLWLVAVTKPKSDLLSTKNKPKVQVGVDAPYIRHCPTLPSQTWETSKFRYSSNPIPFTHQSSSIYHFFLSFYSQPNYQFPHFIKCMLQSSQFKFIVAFVYFSCCKSITWSEGNTGLRHTLQLYVHTHMHYVSKN